MKRLISLLLVLLTVSASSPAYPEEEYDPQHTMLALNMAIVSIHRIVSTQDRIILDQEYNTIINKLALGNIESDYEMTGLFAELMNFITGKGLRQEEAQRFQERYNRREQRQIINALSGIRAYGGNLWSWLGSLATSCVSSYFTYHSAKGELLEGLNDDLWQLKKEEIEDCNDLQVKLLNSSWNLLRQYKLPDEYRLTQETLDGYYKAVNEADPAKRLRMLRARNIEKNFQVYPPYWYYRAKAAQESGDDSETLKCWDKFAEVWRPVLRNDPYKLEEAKYRVQRLSGDAEKNREEIRRLLEVIQDNTTAGDWSNNLFAGVAYFLLGDKDEGITCIQENVDFGYGADVSGVILSQLKADNISELSQISDEIEKIEVQRLIDNAKDKEAANFVVSMFKLTSTDFVAALTKVMERPADEVKNPVIWGVMWHVARLSTPSIESQQFLNNVDSRFRSCQNIDESYKDILPIVRHYVDKGNVDAMFFYARMFYNGRGVGKDLQQAMKFLKPYVEKDNFYGEYLLGMCYMEKSEYENAEKYLARSAEKGYAAAQDWLGDLYYQGKLGDRNYKKAFELYSKAAEQGYNYSIYSLVDAYYQGRGTYTDYYEAYKWLNVASLFGYTPPDWAYKVVRKAEGHKGLIFDDDPALSWSSRQQAKEEAQRKYDEIKKRNGWE
ncbi:MAG: sel1 repeat family protein [Synergistaceae bacterium]|nr:sel1 repeat family protein [Synergistaceae bacterium]